MAVAASARRLHPAEVAADVHLGTRKADVERQVDDGGCDDDVLDTIAERGNHGHREHEQWKGHQHIDEAADHSVEPAAGIAAERADHGAKRKGYAYRCHCDGKVKSRGNDEAAEYVAPELIGPGPMRCARRLKR